MSEKYWSLIAVYPQKTHTSAAVILRLLKKCLNYSPVPIKMATRALDKKYFQQHLHLNYWSKLEIIS